jgi:glycosyltransferase involved in cell wall biosynthesis
MGSTGWLPNKEGADWFVSRVWPEVRDAMPEARLHVFGLRLRHHSSRGLALHPSPAHSRDAFAPGSILVVPVHLTSGVRMKILEAWARGIPVVATPQAVVGLEAQDGRDLLVAETPRGFVDALGQLHADPARAAAVVRAGRAVLRARHAPARVAEALVAVYAEAAGTSGTKKKS